MKYIIWQRFALFLFISTIEVTLIHIFKNGECVQFTKDSVHEFVSTVTEWKFIIWFHSRYFFLSWS